MATLNFVRGEVKGKVGQFVGSSWRGQAYLKTYTKPGNPDTPDQHAVRDVFSHLVHIGTAINEAILKVYDPDMGRKTTAYNRLIQRNKHLFGQSFDFSHVTIFDGALRNPGISGVTATATQITVSWNAAAGGDGTDAAIIIAYNEQADAFFVSNAKTRADASEVLTVPAMTAGEKIHAYLVFAHPNPHGAGYVTSGTAYFTANVT